MLYFSNGAEKLFMKTKNEKLNRLLPEIEKKIRDLFGEKVLKIILFGSYARGDYDPESDVDIFVLLKDNDLRKYRKIRVKVITEFLGKHDILLSIRLSNEDTFKRYKEISPFYQNVMREGISLYG